MMGLAMSWMVLHHNGGLHQLDESRLLTTMGNLWLTVLTCGLEPEQVHLVKHWVICMAKLKWCIPRKTMQWRQGPKFGVGLVRFSQHRSEEIQII